MGQRELATTDFAKSPFNNEEEETEEGRRRRNSAQRQITPVTLWRVAPLLLHRLKWTTFRFSGIAALQCQQLVALLVTLMVVLRPGSYCGFPTPLILS